MEPAAYPPTAGFRDQLTPVFVAPETAASSVTVWDGCNVAVAGATETDTGDTRTIEAVPKMAGPATLAAFKSMVWPAGIEFGAVYNPLDEIVPTAGESDQVTPEPAMPLTVALKFWVSEAASETMAGDTETVTLGGLSATGTLPDSAGFAALCASACLYTAAFVTEPIGELNVRAIGGFDAPVTVAVNVFVRAPFRATPAGAAKTVTEESSDMTARANCALSAMVECTLPGCRLSICAHPPIDRPRHSHVSETAPAPRLAERRSLARRWPMRVNAHVAAALDVAETVAANAPVCDGVNVAAAGDRVTATAAEAVPWNPWQL